jgi:hypothetical protein
MLVESLLKRGHTIRSGRGVELDSVEVRGLKYKWNIAEEKSHSYYGMRCIHTNPGPTVVDCTTVLVKCLRQLLVVRCSGRRWWWGDSDSWLVLRWVMVGSFDQIWGQVLILTMIGDWVAEEAEASLVFSLGSSVLIWLVGTRDPRKQRCVARTIAMLMPALT